MTNGDYTHTEEDDEIFPGSRVIHKNKQTTTATTKKHSFKTGPKIELMMSRGRLTPPHAGIFQIPPACHSSQLYENFKENLHMYENLIMNIL